VWGDPNLNRQFFAIRQQILSLPRNKHDLRLAVSEMREKMRSHLLIKQANHVDLKQSVGGITDIEFLVQYWLLAHANHIPAITQWSDTLRLLDMFVKSEIIDIHQATNLQDCYLMLRREIHRNDLQDQALVEVNADIEAVLNSVKTVYQAVLR
jgi:glutamate-ammonia-ligase adenylyltransferase